jgi:hypothetical protein
MAPFSGGQLLANGEVSLGANGEDVIQGPRAPWEGIGRLPHVRNTRPGLPWGVPVPKTMGDPDLLPRAATNVRAAKTHLREEDRDFFD